MLPTFAIGAAVHVFHRMSGHRFLFGNISGAILNHINEGLLRYVLIGSARLLASTITESALAYLMTFIFGKDFGVVLRGANQHPRPPI